MKTITVIGIIQLVLILILLIKVAELDQQLSSNLASTNLAASAQATTTNPMPVPSTNAPEIQEEKILRKLIREELRAQLNEHMNEHTKPTPQIADDNAPEAVSDAEYQYRLVAVSQTLDYYLEQGRISDAEMSSLQSEIARLDPEGRSQLLSQIARAINSGKLEGEF